MLPGTGLLSRNYISRSLPHRSLHTTMAPVAIDVPLKSSSLRLSPFDKPRITTDAVPVEDTSFEFDSMHDALSAFANGEFLVVVDDEGRENEGDLICAASLVTTEKMAFMVKHTSWVPFTLFLTRIIANQSDHRGYICLSLPPNRLEQLRIPMMVPNNTDRHRTAYTVTVDYKHGTTTGISAHDRALTARKLASGDVTPDDFTRPGHMVPLRAREGGVLTRRGHTEAGVGQSFDHFRSNYSFLIPHIDLCALTNLPPAGLLCELVNDDLCGTMARRDDCRSWSRKWGIKMISIEMIAQYRRQLEALQRERETISA